jgi:hypothetical protein
MLFALLWLTVSTPFVYKAQQQAISAQKSVDGKAGQAQDPFSGTTEEKTESGFSTLSEYLHDIAQPEQRMEVLVKYEKCHSSGLYLAYHPDLLCPPPNMISG